MPVLWGSINKSKYSSQIKLKNIDELRVTFFSLLSSKKELNIHHADNQNNLSN